VNEKKRQRENREKIEEIEASIITKEPLVRFPPLYE